RVPLALLDALIAGLVLGGMYALVALGLNLQYGVARILNLAYGEILVGAAVLAWAAFTARGIAPPLALVALIPLAALFGLAIYRIALEPLVKRSRTRAALETDSLLATFGLLFVVQGVMLVAVGGGYLTYSYLAVPVDLLGSRVAANRLLALGCALGLGIALYLLLARTRIGTAIRGLAVDPTAALLVGIDVRRLAGWTFALGTVLAAMAGVLVSMFLTVSATMGVLFTMKALIVIIMGGVGNLAGGVVAALLLGLAESLVATFVDPALTLAANYALFIAVLLVRPAGLFGRSA
ncbi:MAG TPA: branched-chain amino acid ABC transporter permease, partial [Burkholderiaceae bacterium]|nr:branched-chain amino acid ABC transporter permease [Burkholderiaceae bacterium]